MQVVKIKKSGNAGYSWLGMMHFLRNAATSGSGGNVVPPVMPCLCSLTALLLTALLLIRPQCLPRNSHLV